MSAGELTALAEDRHPWDWYCDAGWETEQFIKQTDVGNEMFIHEDHIPIYDPCCGRAAILRAFAQDGFKVFGSDVEDRGCPDDYWLGLNNFIEMKASKLDAKKLSIAFNPPYSLQDGEINIGLTERFCRHALTIATHKVCALVPLKWLASEGRYNLFTSIPPRAIYILNERPSMPPGDKIKSLSSKAFKEGKIDYIWVVWDVQNPTARGDTKIDFIEPRDSYTKEASHAALIEEFV